MTLRKRLKSRSRKRGQPATDIESHGGGASDPDVQSAGSDANDGQQPRDATGLSSDGGSQASLGEGGTPAYKRRGRGAQNTAPHAIAGQSADNSSGHSNESNGHHGHSNGQTSSSSGESILNVPTPTPDTKLTGDLEYDVAVIKKWFGTACDMVYEAFTARGALRATLIYIDGLVNTQQIDVNVLSPLKSQSSHQQASTVPIRRHPENRDTVLRTRISTARVLPQTGARTNRTMGPTRELRPIHVLKPTRISRYHRVVPAPDEASPRILIRPRPNKHVGHAITLESLAEQVIDISNMQWVCTISELSNQLLSAQAVLLLEGNVVGLALSVAGGEERGVQEPSTEAVIRGPRTGFNENVSTGMALLRRRLKTADLQLEAFQIGSYTGTKVVLCSIKGVAEEELVAEVRERLNRIEIDGILESGYIEELIEDAPYSPFPQMQNTERPDVVAGLLLEGNIAILTDGTPFALIGPINFWGALQSAEDFYERYIVATLIRWLRYVFLFIALFLPSLYVAITTFHQEMLPNKLLMSVAAAREVTPFPAVVEALFMEITFEALREAGVRLPKTVGSAISIVGALVIGQAAVQAGIASAPMVIIVSVTGIASFTIPRYNFALSLRMLRFPMIVLAGTLGLYGIMLGMLGILIHLCSLRSFGVPYLHPVSPLKWKNLKDVFIRVPHWAMNQRPWQTAKINAQRQSDATRPKNRIPRHKH